MMSLTGCALLGTKVVIVKQSITPVPQECKGMLYVATNKPILVGIEGTTVIAKKDMGGYYLIHKEDWKTISKIVKEHLAKNH